MPVEPTAQLALLGQLLDRAAAPVTLDEVVGQPTQTELLPTTGISNDVDLKQSRAVRNRPRRKSHLVASAAAALLVAGGVGVVLTLHRPALLSSDETATTPSSSTTTEPPPTIGLPNDAPPGSVLRFTATLTGYGAVAVFDAADQQTCVFVRGGEGASTGCYDSMTFETGQAWGLLALGPNTPELLIGLAPNNIGFHATIAAHTLTPDENGLWYSTDIGDATDLTITTNQGTQTYPLSRTVDIGTTTIVTATPG